jgi:catechol 2,3-dioxygenase-like lactoylglutathione lyase family enzyme
MATINPQPPPQQETPSPPEPEPPKPPDEGTTRSRHAGHRATYSYSTAAQRKLNTSMIIGAHMALYSADAEADRAFFRDVLGFSSVDAGDGWLIFALPPSETAFHPGVNGKHEFYLMTDEVQTQVEELSRRGYQCDPINDEGWGLLISLRLPGGGRLGLYQPRHARPTSK